MPAPYYQTWNWRLKGKCRDADPATFFGSSDSRAVDPDNVMIAKALCEKCTVRTECLNFAVNAGEFFGIWGGLTERERRQYKWFNYRPADQINATDAM